LEKSKSPGEPIRINGEFPVEYKYTAGLGSERFLKEIQENARLLGSRCLDCDLTYIPTRLFCERCFAELRETVEIHGLGRVLSFTVVHCGKDLTVLERPVTLAVIEFDGVVGRLVHILESIEPPKIGMRVRPEYLPPNSRTGSIMDIRCFTPG
jgi:uncharacterized OB-fold protein